ncbi:MAG: methyltransferase domain-containing protein [Eubacterium sp.]|nr:methyltransferase domain-containing protein [Eubacterium sp.]
MIQRDEWKIKVPPEFVKEDIYEPVYLNQYGYYEPRRKNTVQERNENFEEHYFQDYAGATYEKAEYPPEELDYIHNQIEERAYVIEQNLEKMGTKGDYSLLDIGCGEGFLLQFFHDRGKRVKGIDIGSYALEHFHPEMLAFFEKGTMERLLPKMEERGERYDVVNIDRCLDMVDDVDVCLNHIKRVMDSRSILVVKVANNYSNLQRMLLKKGEMTKEHWLDDPDHTGYMNREGLIARLDANGLECLDFYGDTFVDFHLVNPFTNYYEKPETGKAAHKSTVCLENLFHDISMERTVEICRMLGDMGFGREIVGVFKKR